MGAVMYKRLRMRLLLWSLRRERKRLWLEFAGSVVENLHAVLHDYDLRIKDLQQQLTGELHQTGV
jgi:hypothetical protein